MVELKVKSGAIFKTSKHKKNKHWKYVFRKDLNEVEYHRIQNPEGKLHNVYIKGNQLIIEIKHLKGYIQQISIDIFLDRELKVTDGFFNTALIALDSMEKGDVVVVFANRKQKDKNNKYYRNLIFLDKDDKKYGRDFPHEQIPKWEKINGKWNTDKHNEFYLNLAEKIIKKFKN